MPPEMENATTLQAALVHSNGHSAKLSTKTLGSDFPPLHTNGNLGKSGRLNGIVDLDDQACQESPADEVDTSVRQEESSNSDAEVIQDSREQPESESAADEINVELGSGLPDVRQEWEGPNRALDASMSWSAAEPNSGWEIAEDNGVLGPGPTVDERTVEHRPTPPKEHTFYMIKIPRPTDNKGKTEIRMAEMRLKEKTEKRDFINAALQMKRASRAEALDKLKACREKMWACGDAIRSKKEEIEPLQGALRRLRDTGRLARDKGRDLPASEQELDDRIAYYEYRIQHESIPLKEEKQLLRDIKNLKACREEVCANEALHAEFSESLGEREDIQERLKPLISELESLKTEGSLAADRTRAAEAEFEKMDEAFSQVQAQFAAAHKARQDAYEERATLSRQEIARNDEFFQNRRDIQHVKQLAYKKEKKMVEELCNAQVERVMLLWNGSTEFRVAYMKSNEKSTLRRLQTFDGRALGPDEEPPYLAEDIDNAFDTRTEPATLRSQREDIQLKTKSAESSRVAAHSASDLKAKDSDRNLLSELNGIVVSSSKTEGLDTLSGSSGQEEQQVKSDLAAAAVLKEKRRQQEMAKAREAEERKRRSAERLQSKALARAQKDAERREKEKEKKARKKAASLSASAPGVSLAIQIEGGEQQQLEPLSHLHAAEEVPLEIKPSVRQRKRPVLQKPKTAKTPLSNSLSKKDGTQLPIWILLAAGFLFSLGILALLIHYYYSSS